MNICVYYHELINKIPQQMKKYLIAFLLFLFVSISASSLVAQAQYVQNADEVNPSLQSESYAIVDVREYFRRKEIRITLSEESASEAVWRVERTTLSGDMSPVIKELNRLNQMGYTLHSSSAFPPGDHGDATNRNYTFVLVKKL